MGQQVDERLNMVYEVPIEPIEIPADQASIDRGQHLINTVLFCKECHGDDLGGKLQFNDPLTGKIAAGNLTSGAGGIGSDQSDEDWVLAIRHGVDENGNPLIEMPSEAFYSLSDEDLGAVIAYLKNLPTVDNELPERRLGPLYQLSILSNPSLIPAEVINHDGSRPPAPEPGATVEYGQIPSDRLPDLPWTRSQRRTRGRSWSQSPIEREPIRVERAGICCGTADR